MEVKILEKLVIKPEKHTENRRMFLSMMDLTSVMNQECVWFFDAPETNSTFDEICASLCESLSRLLVPYDYVAGRLAPGLEEPNRLEIDCNGAGAVFVSAKTETELSSLGQIMLPKPEYKKFVCGLHNKDEAKMELKDKPLLNVQLTQFGCGSLAMGIRCNHCIMDGTGFGQFMMNWAAMSRGTTLAIEPNPDRTIYRERNPPIINHPHPEYSTSEKAASFVTAWATDVTDENETATPSGNQAVLVYISAERLASLKQEALKDGKLKTCTIFQAVSAKIWKSWSMAMKFNDETTTNMVFPMNVRNIIKPNAPNGFAGNAVLTSYAQSCVKELKEKDDSYIVSKVQEAIKKMDDDYARSAIDWLYVNRGYPYMDNCLAILAWWRLGLEKDAFSWGKIKCTCPVILQPGVVFILPDLNDEGGINVCIEVPDTEVKNFIKTMME